MSPSWAVSIKFRFIQYVCLYEQEKTAVSTQVRKPYKEDGEVSFFVGGK